MNNKILATVISDTHCKLGNIINELPKSEILLSAGDNLNSGSMEEFIRFCNILGNIHKNYRLILITAGNHCHIIEKELGLCKEIFKEKVPNGHLLIDEEYVYKGIKFYLSPWSPRFGYYSFQLDGNDGKRIWSKIPEDTDFLITHSPPYSIFDTVEFLTKNETDVHVGCKYLLERIQQLNLKCHVMGHIHSGYNAKRMANPKFNNTLFINASICTEEYIPSNKPWLIEIDILTKEVEVVE